MTNQHLRQLIDARQRERLIEDNLCLHCLRPYVRVMESQRYCRDLCRKCHRQTEYKARNRARRKERAA